MRKLGQINNQTEVDKILVGLGNVDNTSDINKPISTATQIALNNKQEISEKGQPNGYASLGNDGKVPTNQLPSAGLGDMLKSVYDAEGGEKQVAFKADVQTALNTKQETLVSGVNIKTINGQSLPGSGDIVINGGLVGTKQVDETNIADGKTLVYKTASGKYELETPSGGGLSWGSSITGTTGTGLTTTIGDNASAGTIGQSIVISNTQTNTLTAQEINTGTSAINHSGTRYTVLQTGSADTSGGIVINSFGSATQAVGLVQGIILGGNFNTNSSFNSRLIRLLNEQNAGSGQNTGIWGNNLSTELNTTTTSTVFGDGAILKLLQSGAGGTTVALLGRDNINSSTNGLVNYTLSNTQSGATVMQKIDLGTSAQGHKGLQIKVYNASTSARGIEIDPSTTGTGYGIDFLNIGGNFFRGINWGTIQNGATGSIYGIFQGTINNSTSGSGIGYGIFQSIIRGGTTGGTGAGYGIYQNTIKSSTTTGAGYGIYQAEIQNGTSGVGYGIYQNSITSGIGWYINNLTAGNGVTGKFFSLNGNTNLIELNSRTLDMSEIIQARNHGGTSTITDNFNQTYIKRTSLVNNASGVFNAEGSVLKLENVATQTAGTLTDTVSVLTLAQGVNTTGSLITMVSGNTNSRAIDFATNLTTTTAPTGASTYINVKINGVAHRILAQAV